MRRKLNSLGKTYQEDLGVQEAHVEITEVIKGNLIKIELIKSKIVGGLQLANPVSQNNNILRKVITYEIIKRIHPSCL